MENAKSYELTLTPNYVSDWNFNDAIRELIQNGTDQEVLDKENHFSIEYDSQRQVLQLKNSKSLFYWAEVVRQEIMIPSGSLGRGTK